MVLGKRQDRDSLWGTGTKRRSEMEVEQILRKFFWETITHGKEVAREIFEMCGTLRVTIGTKNIPQMKVNS